jgi:magnesium-transporting ATPase (P-type)
LFLIKGDYVALYEGDRVPADMIIIQAFNVQVDESLLTGLYSSIYF